MKGYVVTDLDGRLFHPKGLLKRFRAVANAAGVPLMHLHSGRHTSSDILEGALEQLLATELGRKDGVEGALMP